MIKKLWDRFTAWVLKGIKKLFNMNKLELKDLENKGFVYLVRQGSTRKLVNGEYSLKWNTYNDTITIRKGKALRFFGIIETPRELDWMYNKIFS